MHRKSPAGLCLALLACVLGLALPACTTTPATPATTSAPAAAAPDPAIADAVASGPLPPPPGLDPADVTPLTGAALTQARRPIDVVLRDFATPDYLTPRPTADRFDPADEPAVKLQRDYLAARRAIFAGKLGEAADRLTAAREVDPRNADVIELLGEVRLAAGDRDAGVALLRRAVSLDPVRTRTLFLLGRDAMDRERWGEAAAVFHALLGVPVEAGNDEQADPAIRPLALYDLAEALRRVGALAAAVERYRAFLSAADQVTGADSRYGRELMFLSRSGAQNLQAIGDLELRLDRPADALADYRKADEAGVSDAAALVQRMAYADLLLRRPEDARRRVAEALQRHGADATLLALVRYLGAYVDDRAALVDDLQQVYDDRPDPRLAVALADLLPPAEACSLLERHLLEHPADQDVYRRLLELELRPGGRGAAAAAESIRVTAALMRTQPALAERYAVMLLRQARATTRATTSSAPPSNGNAPALAAGFDQLDPDTAGSPQVRVLRAMDLAVAGRRQPAAAMLDRVIHDHPGLAVARVERAKLAIDAHDLKLAGDLLKPLENSTDPAVVALRVRVLSQDGHPDAALSLLDSQVHTLGPASPDAVGLILQKARLQASLDRTAAAEQTLLGALDDHPREQSIYALLFQLYERPGNATADDYRALMRRMLTHIPQSRLARLKVAQFEAMRHAYAPARKVLDRVLSENPMDYDAIALLAEVDAADGQTDKAGAMLDARLAQSPSDPRLVVVARNFYAQRGDKAKVVELTERLIQLQPPGAERSRAQALLYLNTGRYRQAAEAAGQALGEMDRGEVDDPVVFASVLWQAQLKLGKAKAAEAALRAAAKRFPDHVNELEYQLAALVDREGDAGRAAAIMRRIVRRDPDNDQANNALAYSNAVRGVGLDEALRLADRALRIKPGTAAYLDTRGWVLYKLGRFDEAVDALRRALTALAKQSGGKEENADPGTRAVLHDHLGDALYRGGDKAGAAVSWGVTAELADKGKLPSDDPEFKGIGERVKAKLAAVREGGEPKLP